MGKNKDISIQGILKGKFLIKQNAVSYWKFMLFLVVLGLISITSSHIVDERIYRINFLREKINELYSKYTNIHKDFMKMHLESEIEKIMAPKGLKPLEEIPYEIK